MSTLTVKPNYTHPALLTGLATPPLTPISPTVRKTSIKPTPPIVSYAQLRAYHVTAIKYTIARLRWDQMNNGYLRGEDAWINHNTVINKLEKELAGVEAAQKGLDQFPDMCWYPIAEPKTHGPLSKDQFEAEAKAEKEKNKLLDEKLEAQFPFIKQLFIGPRTKQQARNDRLLREGMKEGDFDDLSVLLPSENMRMLMARQANKAGGGAAEKKKSYQEERMEREKAKIAATLEAEGVKPPPKATPQPRIGPLTREEWMATLPRFGPPTRGEAYLPMQREQRHVILSWLRKPWPLYDEDAAELMERLGRMALKKLEAEAKEAKLGKEVKEGKEEKGVKEGKDAAAKAEIPATKEGVVEKKAV